MSSVVIKYWTDQQWHHNNTTGPVPAVLDRHHLFTLSLFKLLHRLPPVLLWYQLQPPEVTVSWKSSSHSQHTWLCFCWGNKEEEEEGLPEKDKLKVYCFHSGRERLCLVGLLANPVSQKCVSVSISVLIKTHVWLIHSCIWHTRFQFLLHVVH